MAKLRLFLSYVTVESRLADLLKAHLEKDFIGLVNVFESSDRLSVPAGSKWLSKVTDALKGAELHVVLCSPEAIKRPWVNFEAGAAYIRGVTVIPVCHSGLTAAQLPVPLSESQAVLASESEGLGSLYARIATALDCDVPVIDFAAFSREVNRFEREYAAERSNIMSVSCVADTSEIVPDPKALCISSHQFLELGFDNQIEKVIKAFPTSLRHERVLSSAELREAVKDEKFDIIHIATFICPRSGDLYFSDIDTVSGVSTAKQSDVVDAEALARLFRFAKVKLTVVGSCDSMALAAILTTVCHVIAPRDIVSAAMLATWVEAFYRSLPASSLAQALNDAGDLSRAPMRFYGKQSAPANMFFKGAHGEALASA